MVARARTRSAKYEPDAESGADEEEVLRIWRVWKGNRMGLGKEDLLKLWKWF